MSKAKKSIEGTSPTAPGPPPDSKSVVSLDPNCIETIDNLLNEPRQMWLLGAGISVDACVPLMYPLTERVKELLSGNQQKDYQQIRDQLDNSAHVEHVLSHLGDLIAIGSRMKSRSAPIGSDERTIKELQNLHFAIQSAIRQTVQWGYKPKTESESERIGTANAPIVQVTDHVNFIKAIFNKRRAGLERRPPIPFFTINYDPLIEDALALCRVTFVDGFNGGAMAFWNPDDIGNNFDNPFEGAFGAKVYKLHGSIDWFVSEEDVVVRRRELAAYPAETSGKLLIYPQSTKYLVTQKDPFARLLSAFRCGLNDSKQTVLGICGYSFGDEHINEDIERALRQRGNGLTVVAFVNQSKKNGNQTGLPGTLNKWLSPECNPWNRRIWVASRYDVFHGSLTPVLSMEKEDEFDWWRFTGLTNFLASGPESIKH